MEKVKKPYYPVKPREFAGHSLKIHRDIYDFEKAVEHFSQFGEVDKKTVTYVSRTYNYDCSGVQPPRPENAEWHTWNGVEATVRRKEYDEELLEYKKEWKEYRIKMKEWKEYDRERKAAEKKKEAARKKAERRKLYEELKKEFEV